MSRKLQVVRIYLNAHVLEAISAAVEEKILPTIQNALHVHGASSSAILALRSNGPYQSEKGGVIRKTPVDILKLNSVKGNHNNNPRGSSVNSYETDEGYDNC